MNSVYRMVLCVLSLFLATGVSLLLVMVDCALEPKSCENIGLVSKLPVGLLFASPILLCTIYPNKFHKTFLVLRLLSVLWLIFPLMIALRNTFNLVISSNQNFTDIIFGPILLLVIFGAGFILIRTELKHLTRRSSKDAVNGAA